MTQDPSQNGAVTLVIGTPMIGALVTGVPIPWPPLSGPGSDREAWMAFAREVAKGSEEAREVLDEQAARIASLEAEVARLQAQLTESQTPQAQPARPRPRPAHPRPAHPLQAHRPRPRPCGSRACCR